MRNRSDTVAISIPNPMKQFIALLLFSGQILPGVVHAGAWLQPDGTAYVRLSGGYLSTSERYDENGDIVPWDTSGGGFRNADYQDIEMILYTEVGFHRGWNLVGMASWKTVEAKQPSAIFQTWGFSDIQIGLKRELWIWSSTVTSAMGYITLPTGYDETDYPALGSGVTDLSLVGMAGTSGRALWATGEAEYRFRGGNFRNQVRGAIGGGWNLSSRFGLRGETRGVLSVGEEGLPTGDPRFDPAKVDPTYLDLAGTVSYRMGRGVALEAEVRSTVSGKNALSGTRWSLALATAPSWEWK